MKILLKSLLNALPGALLTGFAWWGINGFFAGKGGGLLEKQAWPLNDMWVCVACGSVIAVLLSAVALLVAARRRSQLRSTLMSLGLNVEDEVLQSDPSLPREVQCLKDWAGGYNYATGQVNGVDLRILEFHREYRDGDQNVQTQRHTVILQSLPPDLCAPVQLVRRLWSPLFSNADGVVLNADEMFTDPRDVELLSQFNKTFFISPPGLLTSPPSGYINTIQPILQLSFVRALMNGRFAWNVEISDNTLVMWQQNKLLTAGNASPAIQEARQLRQALCEPVRSAAPLTATSHFPSGLNVQVGPIVGGGCAGMFLAMLTFAPIFFLYADKFRWLVFVWPLWGFLVVGLTVILSVRIFGNKD